MTHPNFVRTQAHTIAASRYHRDLNKYTHTGTNRNYVHGEHTIDVERILVLAHAIISIG